MLDIGMMELFVIGALALIIVGPKELPGLLRTVGQFVAKARGMAREFQRSMDEAAREADLGEVADVVKGKGNLNKLPFDNQIVDSMKEFERSVKSEITSADAAVRSEVAEAKTASDATKPAETEEPKAEAAPEEAPAEPKAEAPAAPAQTWTKAGGAAAAAEEKSA